MIQKEGVVELWQINNLIFLELMNVAAVMLK